MFQSYEYIKYLSYDAKTKQYSYQYKIIDSDFEEVAVEVAEVGVAVGVEVEVAVIDVYERRNLNVAANLMLAILYISKEYGYSVQEFINRNKQYNPKFTKYEKELEKYMVLI
jgi:hypothetical protein